MATAAEVLHEYCAHVDQNYLLYFAELNTGDISEDLAIMATDREPLIGSNHPTLGGFVRYLIRSDTEILSLTYFVLFRAMDSIVFGPVYWLRKTIVDPLKTEPYPWYHRRFNRVPGIEDCYTEDVVCR